MNLRWDRSGAEQKLDPHRTTVVMLWADGVEALCVTFPVLWLSSFCEQGRNECMGLTADEAHPIQSQDLRGLFHGMLHMPSAFSIIYFINL